jgi:hypothetical protein
MTIMRSRTEVPQTSSSTTFVNYDETLDQLFNKKAGPIPTPEILKDDYPDKTAQKKFLTLFQDRLKNLPPDEIVGRVPLLGDACDQYLTVVIDSYDEAIKSAPEDKKEEYIAKLLTYHNDADFLNHILNKSPVRMWILLQSMKSVAKAILDEIIKTGACAKYSSYLPTQLHYPKGVLAHGFSNTMPNLSTEQMLKLPFLSSAPPQYNDQLLSSYHFVLFCDRYSQEDKDKHFEKLIDHSNDQTLSIELTDEMRTIIEGYCKKNMIRALNIDN